MGQYYSAVCRDCKVVFHPTLAKLQEIEINESISAEVGRFFVEHRHHDIDLVGDEGDGEYDFEGYEHILTPPLVRGLTSRAVDKSGLSPTPVQFSLN
jgi:hypothetical protein